METLPDDILGQTRPLQLLRSYFANDTIPHAFLFCGPDGVGKKTTARFFAMALNCLNSPLDHYKPEQLEESTGSAKNLSCGQCRACRLLAENKHPDLLHLVPDGAFIKVGQIRQLIEALSLKPVEAKSRVVIIEDVQLLNPAAANALLKTLEEPYAHTVFVLTAPAATDVMPTILSRCQRLAFQPLTADIMQRLLQPQAPELEDWEHIAFLSGGSISKAMSLLKTESMQRRKWLLHEMSGLAKASPARLLSLANELNKTKQYLEFDLDVILSWLRDCLAIKISGVVIINRDFMKDLQYNDRLYTLKSLNERLLLLQKTTANLTGAANTNPRLGWEYLLLALK